jgi:peroxiredoxin
LQAVVPELEKHGASLVAITPQKAEHSLRMIERHKLGFEMLSDPGNAYIARLGLRFQVPDDLKEVYLSLGIDLEESSGSSDWTLPVPARIVVDRTGVVRAADIDVDYTRRPEPEKTLADVAALA